MGEKDCEEMSETTEILINPSEDQRYGRNKDTLVNKTYIESGEYRRKFDHISDNPEVNKAVYNASKKALKHRSGTVFEDMYWFDAESGKIIAAETESTTDRKVEYSPKTLSVVGNYDRAKLITLHTHPSSMPPSVADFNSACKNGYGVNYVAAHDGRLFGYTSQQIISELLQDTYISEYKGMGCSEKEAQIKAIQELMRNHEINFWEVL